MLFSDTLTWLSGLVLSLSSFMSWYSGGANNSGGESLVLSVIGWHTGLIGQLVFFLGLAVLFCSRCACSGSRCRPPCPRA